MIWTVLLSKTQPSPPSYTNEIVNNNVGKFQRLNLILAYGWILSFQMDSLGTPHCSFILSMKVVCCYMDTRCLTNLYFQNVNVVGVSESWNLKLQTKMNAASIIQFIQVVVEVGLCDT